MLAALSNSLARGKPIVLPPPAEASSAAPPLSSRKMTNPPKSASGLLHSRLVLMDRLLLLTTSDVCGRVRPLVTASAMRCSRELAFLIVLLSTRSVTELCSRRLPRLCVAMVVVGGSPLLASVWVGGVCCGCEGIISVGEGCLRVRKGIWVVVAVAARHGWFGR